MPNANQAPIKGRNLYKVLSLTVQRTFQHIEAESESEALEIAQQSGCWIGSGNQVVGRRDVITVVRPHARGCCYV